MEGGAAASSGHDGQQQPPPPPPLSQEEEESASASLPNDGPQAVREERLGSIGAEEKERGQDLPPSTTARRARRRGRRQGGEGSSDGSIEEGGATAAGGGGGGGGNGNEDGGRSVQPLPPTPGDSGGNGGLLSPLTIVLVGGFLLPPGEQFHTLYWGEALTAATGAGGGAQHRILCVHPGPIASLHDRVCEIFYELKGGRVTYGKGHSHRYGHESEGEEEHAGLYPEWDGTHPVHLIGHSFGGLTIRLLLHYLEKQAFPGHDTSPDWVRSVTTINAPHNGTHLVYGLGADPLHPPIVHWGSPGHLLGTLAHLVEFLDWPFLRHTVGMDFGLSHFRLSRRFGLLPGLAKLLKAVLGLSNVCTTPDNAAYDMTVHAALRINKVTTTYPGLFYFSFVGTCARHRSSSTAAAADPMVTAAAAGAAAQGKGGSSSSSSSSSPLSTPPPSLPHEHEGAQQFPQRLTALVKGLAYRLMAWRVRNVPFEEMGQEGVFAMLGPEANEAAARWVEDGASDGVVSVFSQAFPRVPHEEPHHPDGLPEDYHDLVSGRWYVTELPVDHMGVVGYPHSHAWQRNFFQALYTLLGHCHGRVWEGALTPSTPLSSSSSPLVLSPPTASLSPPKTPHTSGGGGRNFTWAALSSAPSPCHSPHTHTHVHAPAGAVEELPPAPPAAGGGRGSSVSCSEDDEGSLLPLPLHRQPTLTRQPSRREIRRLERRGSWALARQAQAAGGQCQCSTVVVGRKQPKQEEKETATTTSPSTRMLLCLECNKGLEKPPVAAAAAPPTTHQQEEEDKEERVGIKEGGAGGVMTLLMSVMTAACLLVLPALVLLLTYPASLLLGSKGGQAAAGVAVWAAVWALVDRNLTHRLWFLPSSHGAISVLYAGFTSLSSVTALLLLARGQGRWWLQRQQQLSFCGFYALALTLSLLSKGNGRKGKGGGSAGAHVPPSRMWQGTMLALHSALLLLLLSSHPNSTMDEPRDGQPPPSPPLLPTLLSLALELPNALLTLRDLLPHTTHPATGLSTRLAAAVWVSIWAAFFLCQLFPAAYLFIMTLALIPSSASRPLLMVVGGGLACVGLVGRMKTLSARFQLDFSKKHVEHVLFGGGRKHD